MTLSFCKKFLLLLAACTLSVRVIAHPGPADQIGQLTHMIQERPDDLGLYVRRGLAYSDSAQYQLALADFEKLQATDSTSRLGHHIGVVYYRMGQFEQALQYLDAFITEFPKSYPSYEYRARVLRDMEKYLDAVTNLEIYFELIESPSPGLYLSAADMLSEAGTETGTTAALALLDRGMNTLGIVPQLQRRAIALEQRAGHHDCAVARMQTLELVLGSSPAWQIELAELLIQVNKNNAAAKLLSQALLGLKALKTTPARAALKSRAAKLQSQLAN